MSLASRIFLGNLSSRANEDDIHKFFKGFGRIREISLKNGFGFVEFDDRRDAEDAVYEMNGKDLMGNKITIEMARMRGSGSFRRGMSRSFGGPPRYNDRYGDRGYGGGGGGGGYGGGRGYGGGGPRRYPAPNNTDFRVIVENLSSRASWQDLKDFMRQAGEVTFADANRNRPGEGLVCFASYSEMKKAVEKLDGKELCGRPVKLIEDYRGGSRSRSRSRGSRSRSRSRGSRSRSPRSRSGSARSRSRSRSAQRNGDRGKSGSKSKTAGKAASHSPSKSPEGSRSRSRSGSRGGVDAS